MSQRGDDEEGPSRFVRVGLVLIVVLAVASAAYNLGRAADPTAELEGLHSPAEAIAECRRAIDAGLGVEVGPLAAEHLGGGEYEVRGVVAGSAEPEPAEVLCEVAFGVEDGWRVLDVAVSS